ncbi:MULTISPECIES: DUF2958 domain-containing protein [Thalassospira]|uniref:DUF2958 domain-containing protein n=1 Tax=Thalassospira indica TaxID=1891279 RepID=A0ABM6Y533_9PROT|nr:DUF2958 domain-containing protein [Thalassospira indica]AXO17040.1 DUF2958 domain-containing protein [Thalassospira indica]
MKLITKDQRLELLTNGLLNARRLAEGEEIVHVKPVVRLFAPWNAATWLLSEIDPEDEDIAFGLCDLGMGCPELGSVRLSELESVRGPAGLRIERDRHFKGEDCLWVYARAATVAGRITEDTRALNAARDQVMNDLRKEARA